MRNIFTKNLSGKLSDNFYITIYKYDIFKFKLCSLYKRTKYD